MNMLLLSFAGSALAYFAFMSAASSAASAQAAAASNWPPTTAQQQALQVQISQLVVEVTGQVMTAQEQTNLSALLANAPAQYQAGLPTGAAPTVAGYSSWVLAGSAAQAAASLQTSGTASPYGGPTASGYVGAGPLPVPPNRRPGRGRVGAPPPDNMVLGRVEWDSWNDPWLQIYSGRMDATPPRYPYG